MMDATQLSNPIPALTRSETAGEGRIVKRQPKAPEDVKAKYLAPRAGDGARALVQRALNEAVDAQFQAFVQTFVVRYNAEVAALIADLKAPLPADGIIRLEHVRLHRRALQERSPRRPVATSVDRWVAMTPEARDAAILERATRDAQEIRDNFVIKNLSKLDSIVEAKGDFEKITAIEHSLAMGTLEGHFLLTFKDGSSFEVRNSFVFVENQHGTRFHRFPLTFHNVRLSGGNALASPSEERMNTVFVGKVPV